MNQYPQIQKCGFIPSTIPTATTQVQATFSLRIHPAAPEASVALQGFIFIKQSQGSFQNSE